MKKTMFTCLFLLSLSFNHVFAQQAEEISNLDDVQRILETLASDEMRGRSALSAPDIARAADFIGSEFRQIGVQPYAEDTYRQTFQVSRTHLEEQSVRLGETELDENEFLIVGSGPSARWTQSDAIETIKIEATEDFSQAFRSIVQGPVGDRIVLVDSAHSSYLTRFKKILSRESIKIKGEDQPEANTKVFIIGEQLPEAFQISLQRKQEDFSMFNVAAVIPGKSKAEEYVIFSCHYDHIGIIDPEGQDSIANGADDDASGTTAMIELARYFKKADLNERTLIFVAFTGEEIGMFGSKYFSNQIDPDAVVAMINIEMIGKDAKFGPNSLYITGYDASDLGRIMQQRVRGSSFTFHPDPYPTQNLFYRSDNAVLAALGVPAHTFSTSQIDKDEYYHTVKDEVSTLEIENIHSSIKAIALGVEEIVTGKQTPSRVEKLRD
ncbi:MAG: M20/M25/M40 family metallo-hydrolase [Sphingobacterium sp.]